MKGILWAYFALLVAVTAEVGCQNPGSAAKAKRIPTLAANARPANTAGLSADELNQGAKLSTGKCLRCHPLYDPAVYNDAEWHSWMTRMAKKAHLKPEQAELLGRYLGAFRELK